jgi:hypothetical protein
MDPSDNVVTLYLVTIPGGLTAQASRQNQAANPTVVAQINGSDNRLLAVAMANALVCTPYKAPNLIEAQPPPYTDKTLWIGAMALNEIHAQVRQQPPIALLPRGNPMVQVKAQAQAAPVANPAMLPFMQSNSLATIPDLVKVNNYREALNQPRVNTLTEASTAYFCAHFAIEHIPRLQGNMVHFKALTSPMPDVATNLFAFMGQRFANSWDGMQCGTLLDMPNPVLKIFTGNLVSDCTLSPNVAQWQQRLEIIDPYGA